MKECHYCYKVIMGVLLLTKEDLRVMQFESQKKNNICMYLQPAFLRKDLRCFTKICTLLTDKVN